MSKVKDWKELSKRAGFSPSFWAEKTEKEFLLRFKGFATTDQLKEVYKSLPKKKTTKKKVLTDGFVQGSDKA